MVHPNIRDIAIVGGGVAGWLTAAILARALPPSRYAIRLVEPAQAEPDLETLAGGVAALPALNLTHDQLGLREDALVRQADAGFSLGTEFAGWTGGEASYFRPFTSFGAALDGIAFHKLWLRMRQDGDDSDIADHSLAAVAAGLGRFAFPSRDPASVLSTLDHGLHLDGGAYSAMMRGLAEARGVTRIEGDLATVELSGESGAIATAVLEDGRRIEADFFIDCTGARAALIGEALGTPFEDWSRWLPCDRAVAARGEGARRPCLGVEARSAGWHWRMPLRRNVGFGHVYASAYAGDDEAAAGLPDASAPVAFASGRRTTFWSRNCVAIGASACVLDPLEPSALQAIARAAAVFLMLLPWRDGSAGGADEYNRIMTETADRMRDLVILHYKANARSGAFWDECRAMPVPDSLAYKMHLFETKGRVLELDEELFLDPAWVAVYLGQGIVPRNLDATAHAFDAPQLRQRLAAMRKAMRAAAESMPPYERFLEAVR